MGTSKLTSIIYLGLILNFTVACGDSLHSAKTVTSPSVLDPQSQPQQSNSQGKLLYETNCQACHGQTPNQSAWAADSDKIKAAILIITQMQQPSIFALEDSDIELISQYLLGLAGTQVTLNPTNPTNPTTPNVTYTPPSAAPLQRADAFGQSGAQRLTKLELLDTVEQNLHISISDLESMIPTDSSSSTYYANDYQSLSVTNQMVKDYSDFAETVSKRYNAQVFSQDIGCQPSGPQDFNCFRSFLRKMGRRFLRRPLTNSEVQKFENALMTHAQSDGRFMTAVELSIEALVQHPEFIYRLEINGTSAAGGLTRLSQYEIATRMSFLLLGRGPSDQLLDRAAANQLATGAQREAVAKNLLSDPLAIDQINEFHGRWLAYGEIFTNHPLANDFLLESDKLMEQTHFVEKADWLSIFNSSKSYLTPALANHYGISGVSQPKWVKMVGEKQSGILSHAGFAMVARKFSDTSPTLRGYEIYKRLYCGSFDQAIPPSVDTTVSPGNPNDCKPQRYQMRSLSTCAACHGITDGIGFGLEGIDQFGNIRDFEPQNNQCEITGEGDLFGETFTGPRELAGKIADDPAVGACATKNYFEFMMGRKATTDDQATLDALEGEYFQTRNLQGIIKAIVRSEAMAHKGSQ